MTSGGIFYFYSLFLKLFFVELNRSIDTFNCFLFSFNTIDVHIFVLKFFVGKEEVFDFFDAMFVDIREIFYVVTSGPFSGTPIIFASLSPSSTICMIATGRTFTSTPGASGYVVESTTSSGSPSAQ